MINTIEYLEDIVVSNRNKVAIIDSSGEITFGSLQHKAKCIGYSLNHDLVNEPIAVFLPKSIDSVISFLGVLYSGNFYVPIDVKSPGDRVEKILNNLNPKQIITTKTLANKIQELNISCEINFCFIDEVEETFEEYKFPYKCRIDTDPIYCIYTSGSTGVPKGVLLNHKAVIDFIEWVTECYGINQDTRLGNQSPFIFDVSVLDIYSMLKTGATMYIIPEILFSFPIKLLEYVEEHKINFVIWVPSVLINVVNSRALEEFVPKSLNKILFAGEVMPNKHLNVWRGYYPKAIFSNLYGPTEAAVIASYYIVDRDFDDHEPLPIGFPCNNIDLLVLNDSNLKAKEGELGELCIRGNALAQGYWHDEEKTSKVFVQNPLNKLYPEKIYKTGDLVKLNEIGELIYLGRKDSQIKHNGYRIELGEIENSVLSINQIKNACVLYNNTEKQICLFYQSDDSAINDLLIRRILITILPKYMVPTQCYKLDQFPLNGNCKIDRTLIKNRFNLD